MLTVGPSTYKIPGSRDVPMNFNVKLLENSPNNKNTIFRSKAVGEPPLMLALSAFLALKNATNNANLKAPAIPENILMSIEKNK